MEIKTELDAGEDKRIDIGLEALSASYGSQDGNKIRNDLGMKFVYISPGSFDMGSPASEPKRGNDERQHRVTLTKGFYPDSFFFDRIGRNFWS